MLHFLNKNENRICMFQKNLDKSIWVNIHIIYIRNKFRSEIRLFKAAQKRHIRDRIGAVFTILHIHNFLFFCRLK